MANDMMKVIGWILAAALFSLLFITGAIKRFIPLATLWFAGKPAWFWALVITGVALILWAHDNRKQPR